jgi:hypothetical protein
MFEREQAMEVGQQADRYSQRYYQLTQELAGAYGTRPWNSGEIDRLADEIAAVERQMTGLSQAQGD